MKIIDTIRNAVTGFVTREFTDNPHGTEAAVEMTFYRLLAGFSYLAFSALILFFIVCVIRFVLGNFGIIAETLFVTVVAYFVGMLVLHRVAEINREKATDKPA